MDRELVVERRRLFIFGFTHLLLSPALLHHDRSATARDSKRAMDAPRLALAISSSSPSAPPDNSDHTSALADRRGVRTNGSHNTLARGLARRYGDQRGRAEALKARISRQAKQLAILEAYNRRREADNAAEDDERLGGGATHDDTRTPKGGKQSTSVVGPVPIAPRATRLRIHSERQDNQSEDQEDDSDALPRDDALQSPTEEDLARFAALATSPNAADLARLASPHQHTASTTSPSLNAPAARGSSLDKSSVQVLCELRATKEIVVREQTLQQLRALVPTLHALAERLSDLVQKRSCATARLSAAATSPVREKRGSASLTVAPLAMRRPESGQVAVAVVERDVKQLTQEFAEAAATARRRLAQFATLLHALRDATMNAADVIVEWRHLREQRCRMTNFRPLFRFPWGKRRVLNYLAHMDSDVQFLYETPALRAVLDPTAAAIGGDRGVFSPLLLPLNVLEALGFADGSSFVSTTFLTERRSDDSSSSSSASSTSTRHYEALLAAMSANTTDANVPPVEIDLERARRCLETLQREQELERAEALSAASEQQRVAEAYNPFSAIKDAGGVDEALAQVVAAQSPHIAALAQQLRHRQQDTTRASASVDAVSSSAAPPLPREPSARLRVNSRRLLRLLEQRKEQASAAADCEVRSVPTFGATRNKLRGQLVVRKLTLRRQQHAFARTIQRQFRVHRVRRSLLQGLTRFVEATRGSAVTIQRVFRGHCAKRQAHLARTVRDAARRRLEAGRLILHAYRRYKRRLRHRRSMTVESIAQAQLFSIQYQKLQDEDGGDGADAVDRYRRVGEERRRQRVVLLQRRRVEQLALEQRRTAAAVKLQAFVRGHLAKCELAHLRKEHKSHVTAVCIMTLQSQVRRFLKRQDARRLRFRQDLERVNRSAVRIQSIYRGYTSRASLCGQLDETLREALAPVSSSSTTAALLHTGDDDDQDGEDDEQDKLPPLGARLSRPVSTTSDGDSDEATVSTHDGLHAMLAMLSAPSPAAAAVRASADVQTTKLPPLRPSLSAAAPLTQRRASFQRPQVATPVHSNQAMTRVELKLKEPQFGDDFDASTPPSRRRSSLRTGST